MSGLVLLCMCSPPAETAPGSTAGSAATEGTLSTESGGDGVDDGNAGAGITGEGTGGSLNLQPGGNGGGAGSEPSPEAVARSSVQGTLGGPECTGGPGSAVSPTTPASLAQCPRHLGPSFDEFFAQDKLATLRIEIPDSSLEGYAPDDWVALLWDKWTHCAPFDPVTVQVQYESPDGVGDVTLQDVAMRFRGSWPEGTNAIQGFKLDVQHLDPGGADGKRRFADLNRINVLSVERDASHMVPCLTYNTLREAGLPAPRCNHLQVYVNGEYYGLMGNVEQVNDGYTRRHFGSSAGSLYGGSPSHGDCDGGFEDSQARFAYTDDSFASYADQYELTSATAAEAEADLLPMLACGDAAQTPDEDAFKQCISEWLDVEQWLGQIAAESVMPSLESMLGYYRNFYLYFSPDEAAPHGGRIKVWSWDMDTSFHEQGCTPSNCDIFTSVAASFGPRNRRAQLLTRLTTAFRPEYCAAAQRFVTGVMTPALVDAMAATLEPGLEGEPSVSRQQWQQEVNALREHIVARAAEVQGQLDAGCP